MSKDLPPGVKGVCVACRWHVSGETNQWCRNPALIKRDFDPVVGWTEHWDTCERMRAWRGPCGPEGRHYEQRDWRR